jgi:UDPglucose 6-dehydrogenase
VALSYTGHEVLCIDKNPAVIASLCSGRVPFHEPGLQEMLADGLRMIFGGWEIFDTRAEVIFITAETPAYPDGRANLGHVENIAEEIGRRLDKRAPIVVVVKSTVPPGTARRVERIISATLKTRGMRTNLSIAANPEFLREGAALRDIFYPDRIVVGTRDPLAAHALRRLYTPILEQTFKPPAPLPQKDKLPVFLTTTPESAELIKYAANAFLAIKISFINEFAGLAEHVGADITEVARGVGLDQRIGPRYLSAGAGWGGSCFSKDISAMLHTARQFNYDMFMLEAAVKANLRQCQSILDKLQSELTVIRGTTIGLLGIAFKPDTDDVRNAPCLCLARRLIELGAAVKVYDPVAIPACRRDHPDLTVIYAASAEEAAENSHALVLITEWEAFRHMDYAKLGQIMRQKLFIDGRNALSPVELTSLGFKYIGVGRSI